MQQAVERANQPVTAEYAMQQAISQILERALAVRRQAAS
jgi:hypothetical protein